MAGSWDGKAKDKKVITLLFLASTLHNTMKCDKPITIVQ
jgi:hypothetical protein